MSPKLLNLLLLIMSGILYYMVITPLYTGESAGLWAPDQGITSLLTTKSHYEGTIRGIKSVVDKANNLRKEYDLVKDDQDLQNRLTVMVPDTVNDIVLLSELTKIATESGVAVKGTSVKDKGNGKFDISFTVETTYKKFKDFITNYEHSMRLMSLNALSFSAPAKEDDPVKFSISLSTYYLNSKK